MAATGRAPNKHDVELARLRVRRDIGSVIAYGVVVAVCIVASAVPLWAIHGIIQPLAGKKTQVNANVVISISLAATLALNGFQYLKGISRRGELKRLREENKDLLKRLGLSADDDQGAMKW